MRLLAPTIVLTLALLGMAAASIASPGTSAPRAKPLDGMTINVDPGHNPGNARNAARINRVVQAGPIRKACDTVGASTNDGFPEHRFTLQLATRVVRRLKAAGATVTLTHNAVSPAWGPCITQRAAIGNEADAAISLHADGNTARSARGFHVIKPGFVRGYTGDITKRSGALAVQLRDAMDARTAFVPSTYVGSRGLDTRTDLGGLVLSDVPKVFLEVGNMRHAGDAALLSSAKEQDRVAAAVVAAFVAWHAAEAG